MHLLKYVSVVLAILTVVSLAVALGEGGRTRKRWFAAAAICVLTATTIFVGLANAQQPICTTLGGSWIAEEHSCRNEFGGNGNNDPGNGLTFN